MPGDDQPADAVRGEAGTFDLPATPLPFPLQGEVVFSGDTALLTSVLTYHVVPSLVLAADVPFGTPVTTVEGGTFTVASTLAITDGRNRTSNITTTDVFASNGVIHVIDKVILPPAAA